MRVSQTFDDATRIDIRILSENQTYLLKGQIGLSPPNQKGWPDCFESKMLEIGEQAGLIQVFVGSAAGLT